MKSNLLVTGFEPFLKEKLNPSKEVVLALREKSLADTLILPVSYEQSWELLKTQIEENDYQFVLMLGQAGGKDKILIEKVALNLQDTISADEDGIQRLDQSISDSGPEAFISQLPLREWISTLQNKQRPVVLSLSAGAFVCNSVYYQAVEYLQNQNQGTECLFVHLPYLPEQVSEKVELPSLDLKTMLATVQNLIELILL